MAMRELMKKNRFAEEQMVAVLQQCLASLTCEENRQLKHILHRDGHGVAHGRDDRDIVWLRIEERRSEET
jgi:hypothetical protein